MSYSCIFCGFVGLIARGSVHCIRRSDIPEPAINPLPPPAPQWRIHHIPFTDLVLHYFPGPLLSRSKRDAVVVGALEYIDKRINQGDHVLPPIALPFEYDTPATRPVYLDMNVCLGQEVRWSQLRRVTSVLRGIGNVRGTVRGFPFEVWHVAESRLIIGTLGLLKPNVDHVSLD